VGPMVYYRATLQTRTPVTEATLLKEKQSVSVLTPQVARFAR
jgi:hypothetical protein